MSKYKLTLRTVLETEDLSRIQKNINQMGFSRSFDVRENIDNPEFLIEETEKDFGLAKTFIEIKIVS